MALPPPRTAEIFYDDAWHPVSVRESDTVSISRGLSGAGTRAEPTASTMTLGNRNGALSVYDPTSPVYGKVGRGTPLRFAVSGGGPRLVLPGDTVSALTTPNHASLSTSDLDVRVEIASDDYSVQQDLAERWLTTGNQRSWTWQMLNDRQMQLRWSTDGTGTALGIAATLTRFPAYPGQRIALRATLDVDNGAGGWTATFFWARSLDAKVWHLIETQSASGVTSVHAGTAGLRLGTVTAWVGPGFKGRMYGMQLRNGIDGALAVDLDIERDAAMGASSFTDGTGRVWSLAGAAALSNTHTRLSGEVPAWPPQRHISGNDSVIRVAPAGILRRLGTGKKPLQSALRRAILAAGPIECWPLTDGPESSSGTPLIGTRPIISEGGNSRFSWGKGQLAEWIEPVLQVDAKSASRLTATPPPSTAANAGWAVDWVRAGAVDVPSAELYHFVDSGPEGAQWVWTVQANPQNDDMTLTVSRADNGEGPDQIVIPSPGIYDGAPHHLRLRVINSGSDSQWSLWIDGVERANGSWTEPTSALFAIAPVFVLNLVDGAPAVNIGYLTYWGPNPPPAADLYQAMLGHSGERAANRFLRVSAEQGVPAACEGDPARSEPLGAQTMDGFLDILETASDSDLGLLLDRRDAVALLYRTRASLYSQPPVVTLDYSNGVVGGLEPKPADSLVRNEFTAVRKNGAGHTAVQEHGPLSVQDPPDGIGRYDAAKTLSLATDSQTIGQAWWRLHLGTINGLQYPQVTVDLANPRAAALIADLLRADVGDLLRLHRLPPEYGPGDVDLLIRGYTETIGAKRWQITFVCDPGGPWTVGVLGDRVLGRADTAGCVLGAGLDDADTSVILSTTKGPRWIRSTTHASQFPFSLTVGGEEVSVTALTDVAEDAFARTVTSGWGAAGSGQAWTMTGGAASDYSVTPAGGALQSATSRGVLRAMTIPVPTADVDLSVDFSTDAVPAGDSSYGFLAARWVSAASFYMARLQIIGGGTMVLGVRKRIANNETQLGAFTLPGVTYAPGTAYRLRFAVQGSTLRAKAWRTTDGEPTAWQVTAADGDLTAAGSIGVRSVLGSATTNPLPVGFRFADLTSTPQLATVTRSVNGVEKPHPAGAAISLTRPMVAAL
ncbi:hypothetical protein HHL19_36435 [Streptomyces sp. R302]|uniref:hypothetical protein n=1 Tax=unclassified Streptomyces TaxID=2593676 RepID=UPI00145D9502|nr:MULTISPECIES: hypothetical protein [unclassified Streptomyces]NML55658.1 hypothetical protein [Streptomyces sp. R301]NML84000.1 hypothetical protein [Streptomyces sp. R302]